ncbi:MAG: AraC family transcriptional regulator [Syntrophomonadaceae bacterium]|nr:AraC family transcriptional regulator [Syntrophomonadaceae bacterium]
MKDISERVSYLQGLSEGINLNKTSPQGKIIAGILAVLGELADEITYMQNEFDNIKEYVESIDDDLLDIEEHIFAAEEEFIEFDCSHCGENLYFETNLLDEEEAIEIICPNCDEVVFINDGAFDFEHANMEPDFLA